MMKKIFLNSVFTLLILSLSWSVRATPWELLPSGTTTDLNDLFFVNPNVGYSVGGAPFAIGGPGTILKTMDGGDSWVPQSVPSIPDPPLSPVVPYIQGIHCASPTLCFAVGSSGAILKTTDGTSWSGQLVEGEGIGGAPGRPWFQDVHIVSVSGPVVLAVGTAGMIFRTTNGETWSQIEPPSLPESVIIAGPTFQGLTCANAAQCWAVGSGYVLKTENGGISWIIEESTLGGGGNDIVFFPPTTLFISGGAGFIHKSINMGVSFDSEQFSPLIGFHDLHIVDSSNGWTVGASGIIRKTVDGGASWYGAGGGGDAGLTPEQLEDTTSGVGVWLRSIQCLGSVPCFIAGDDGVLLRRSGLPDLNMIPGGSMACAPGYLHYIQVLRNSGGAASSSITRVESILGDGTVFGTAIDYASSGLAAGATEVIDHVRSGLSTAELFDRFVPPGASSVTLRFTVDVLGMVDEGPAGEANNAYEQTTPCATAGAGGGGGSGGEMKKKFMKKKEEKRDKRKKKWFP